MKKTPPQTLADIFEISNSNRKKNKLRKKTTKLADGRTEVPLGAAPPANI
jgi:hypothetical protein